MSKHPSRLRAIAFATLLVAGLASGGPALAASRVLYQGAGFALTADDVRFGPAKAPTLSLRRAWLHGLGVADGRDEQHDVRWRLLSVVGPLVSVETHSAGYAEGAAHPYAYADITAYDARTGVRATLTDWFPAADVHAALLGDALVRRALAGPTPKPRTLERLGFAIPGYQSADCTWGFSSDLLSRFAFHHVKGDRVAVRFGLSHGCEVARGNLTVLAVYLPIPQALRAHLAAAQAGRAGFLVPGAPRGEARGEVVRGQGMPR